MSTPTDDAQRILEQRALRNVRNLVDKLEAEEAQRRRGARGTLVLAAVVVAVIGIAVLAWWLLAASPRVETRTLELPKPQQPAQGR